MPEPSDTLVWVDVETTGLDYEKDMLMEVGMVATNYDLVVFGEFHTLMPYDYRMEKLMKEQFNGFVWEMHTKNGLIKEMQEEEGNLGYQGGRMQKWMKQYENSLIAGHTCNFDRYWIDRYFPEVGRLFHYRQFDIGTMKQAIKQWSSFKFPEHEDAHRSIPDCLAEIDEAKAIRHLLATGVIQS